MKLMYSHLNLSFELEINRLNSIVVEDADLLFQMLWDMQNQINKESEQYFLVHEDEKCDLNKSMVMVTSPIDLIYDKRYIQKKLFDDLMYEMQIKGISDEIAELYAIIIDKLNLINCSVEYNLDFADSADVMDILKLFDVRIRKPEGSFPEQLMEYAVNIKRFQNKNIFVLANCDAYISDKDYKYIETWAQHYEIYLIFLRNMQHSKSIDYNEYIIDKDLCILH